MTHDPQGASKLRDFHFSVWIKRRSHRDDVDVPAGAMRDPDEWLELTGEVHPARVMEFLEDALLRDRKIYGVLIATRPEE